MLRPSRPSLSRILIAASVIASTVIGSRRARLDRRGDRCQGGSGTSLVTRTAYYSRTYWTRTHVHARTVFDEQCSRNTVRHQRRVRRGGVAMNTRTPAQIRGPVTAGGYPRRWIAAVAMMAAVLMDMIDVTIVNVALPTIRHDLGASATQLEWVVSAYMLAFAAVLITAGSLGDLFGRKRLFLAGIAVFGLASLGAGLSQTAGQLIAARVVQGAAAAVMTPQLLATFRTMFSGRERGQAFGIYGAVLGLASAVGLILGGVLTSADLFGWGWRSVFFVNIPIALVSLAGAFRAMPETRERTGGRIDVTGALLLTAALVAITYPLLEGRSLGWPAWSWALLAAGVAALVLLGLIEARRQHRRVAPLLRTKLFRVPAFTTGLIVQLAFAAGIQGFFLIFTLWVQTGQHYSPLRA